MEYTATAPKIPAIRRAFFDGYEEARRQKRRRSRRSCRTELMPSSAHRRTLIAPAVAVAKTLAPTDFQRATTRSFGNPQRLPYPLETMASVGEAASTNGMLEDVRLPWCGITTTSTGAKSTLSIRSRSATASMSPVRSKLCSPTATNRTQDESLPCRGRSGFGCSMRKLTSSARHL